MQPVREHKNNGSASSWCIDIHPEVRFILLAMLKKKKDFVKEHVWVFNDSCNGFVQTHVKEDFYFCCEN